MVNCGVCHKSIKVTRDQHYYDDKTRKRYHLACIVDVCPECNKPITKVQEHKKVAGQEYHVACVQKKPVHSRKNPIGITSGEDFLKWWSQGLSLGLIRVDGTVVDWPDWGRWTDWWSHGLLLGIVSTTPNMHLESGENIIDYLVRSFTLGLITTGGKPSVLQKKANDMAKEELIPKISLPKLTEPPVTNPDVKEQLEAHQMSVKERIAQMQKELKSMKEEGAEYYRGEIVKLEENIGFLKHRLTGKRDNPRRRTMEEEQAKIDFDRDFNDTDLIESKYDLLDPDSDASIDAEMRAEGEAESYNDWVREVSAMKINDPAAYRKYIKTVEPKYRRDLEANVDRYVRNNPSEVWVDEDEMRENPLPLLIPAAMMAAPYVADAADKVVRAYAPPPKQPPAPASIPQPNPPKGVQYILVSEGGKVYANKFGTKDDAESEARDIRKRSGIVVRIVYPSGKATAGAKRVGSLVKGS